jgi:hypothetical protein
MENPVPINSGDLSGMLGHWLGTPPGGYLGQSYGVDVKALLQTPMASGIADGILAKARVDVPLTGSSSLNLYSYDADVDKKVLVFEVAGELISVGGA